ncbi:MAG: transketolase [Desulfobacterales bacterium]|nr:transketolase [Desulfobacterales bacterium]
MRQTCLNSIYELAKNDERIFFLGSDLGAGVLDQFKKNIPGRFFMEGVSEANIIGIAAGLGLEDKIVYVNTIATFITRRCFEQVVLDICLHKIKVRLIGNGGGLVYAPLGPTHMAIEDIAIFRAIPNMAIIAPADADEMRRFMPLTVDYPGPLYIRLAKGGDPIVSRQTSPFEIGKAIQMSEGKDVLIITTGITLKIALDSTAILEKQGIKSSVIHMPTIKPIDSDTILRFAVEIPIIVTIEEHSIIGGLGSAVSELIAEANFTSPKRFKRIGIPDIFPDEYGSQSSLMERFAINTENLISTIHQLAKKGK